MPFVGVVLVLAAAALHAAWNLTLHSTEDRPATMAVAGLLAGAMLLPGVVLAPPWPVLPLVVLSALAETAYALCLAAAYRRGTLAVAYPIARGTAPLLVTLGGWVVLGEPIGVLPLAGAVALAGGLSLIGLAGWRARQLNAVGFALLVGAAIATYSLIDARAVHQVSPVGYLGVVMGLQGVFLACWIRGDQARLQRALRPGIWVAVGSTAAYLLVLLAFQRAGAGRVATLREVSVIIGLLLVGRTHGWRTWLGAGAVVVGAVLTAG